MHRSKTYHTLILNLIFISILFVSQHTIAKEVIFNNTLQLTTKSDPVKQGDIIFDLQEVDPEILRKNIEKLKSTYKQQQQKLEQKIADGQLNIGDFFITIIVPGGLLYAGYRKQKLEQTKNALLDVTSEITDLSKDLAALRSQEITRPIMVAQMPQ